MSGRRRRSDHYAKRAKREHFPARSVYKLEEIDRRVRLIRPKDRVLDLGASPGSWSLFCADRVGPRGLVVAVDRAELKVGLPAQGRFLQASALDITREELAEVAGDDPFDAVISDMAPRTSGHRFVDQARSFALFARALEIAVEQLRPGGRFAAKLFQGEDFETAQDQLRAAFVKHRIIRPKSVRAESFEIYLVGLEKK